MAKRNVVLLSAGLDSTVNFYMANNDGGVELAITIDYGQTAAPKEICLARELTKRCGVKHQVINLPWMKGFSPLSLNHTIENYCPSWLTDSFRAEDAAKKVWVPNHNGIITNIAAGVAEAVDAERVIFGANWDEGQHFSDNTQEFSTAMNWVWLLSTKTHITLHSYTFSWGKKRIFQKALELGVDLSLLWPCYRSGAKLCGRCLSCVWFWSVGEDSAKERLIPLFAQIPQG